MLQESLKYLAQLPCDVTIVSGDNDNNNIQTNKHLLSVVSPTLRQVFSGGDSFTLLLPDCTTSSIKNIINIISSTDTDKDISINDFKELLATSKLLSIEISDPFFVGDEREQRCSWEHKSEE